MKFSKVIRIGITTLALGYGIYSYTENATPKHEVMLENSELVNGYDVRLVKKGNLTPYVWMAIGQAEGEKDFSKSPFIVAYDHNADGTIDDFRISSPEYDGRTPENKLKELASIKKLSELEGKLLK